VSSFEDLDLVILKGLISDKDKATSFVYENADAKLFSPDVWAFANIAMSYIRTYKEVPTLQAICDKLKKDGKERAIDGIKNIWSKLESTEMLPQEFAFNVDKLKDRYRERELSSLKERLTGANAETAVKDIQSTLQKIQQSKNVQTFENKSVRDYLPTFTEKFKSKRDNPNFEHGLKTGFSYIDIATNGLREADFILCAGSSGAGKSILMNSLSTSIWLGENKITDTTFKKGADCIYFSLEMPYEDCFFRFLSGLAGVPSRSIENAKLTKEEFGKIKQALDFIKRYPYDFKIVDLSDPNCNDLDVVLEEDGKHYDLITVDYLNIMQSNSGKQESDHLMQGAISYELRMLARKHKSIMLTGNQLNRATGGGEKIGLHRLSRAGQIATNCTLIMQIEDRENESKYSDMSIHIIKNRRGAKGSFSMLKNLACSTLTDIPVEEDDFNKNEFTDLEDISEDVDGLDF